MTLNADLILEEIVAKVEAIEGVSALDGFLVHYADDLLNQDEGIGFPCVAIQLDSEDTASDNAGKLKLERQYKVIGAVDALDAKIVNKNLNKLLHDVRVALYSDQYKANTSKAIKIELSGVKFKLPDSSDIYALFEATLTTTYIEII